MTNNKPLVSVVVPAYNVDQYIDKCIQSVLAQTYNNWELLLVVGGQDRTVEICDAYANLKTSASNRYMTITDWPQRETLVLSMPMEIG